MPIADNTDPLVLDLVEWIAGEPRLYSEVIDRRSAFTTRSIRREMIKRGKPHGEFIS